MIVCHFQKLLNGGLQMTSPIKQTFSDVQFNAALILSQNFPRIPPLIILRKILHPFECIWFDNSHTCLWFPIEACCNKLFQFCFQLYGFQLPWQFYIWNLRVRKIRYCSKFIFGDNQTAQRRSHIGAWVIPTLQYDPLGITHWVIPIRYATVM